MSVQIERHERNGQPLVGIVIRVPETRGDWMEVLKLTYYGIGTLCVSALFLMILGTLFAA